MTLTRNQLSIMYALAALLVLAAVAAPRSAHAFDYSGVGGKLGYSSSEDLDGTATLGVHAEMDQMGTRLHLMPNMMYWRVNGVRDLSPNFDVYYHFNPEGRMTPYLGGGLGLNFYRNDRLDRDNSALGLNLMGGFRFPGSTTHYFVEGRYTASDIPQASVLAGVTFEGR